MKTNHSALMVSAGCLCPCFGSLYLIFSLSPSISCRTVTITLVSRRVCRSSGGNRRLHCLIVRRNIYHTVRWTTVSCKILSQRNRKTLVPKRKPNYGKDWVLYDQSMIPLLQTQMWRYFFCFLLRTRESWFSCDFLVGRQLGISSVCFRSQFLH